MDEESNTCKFTDTKIRVLAVVVFAFDIIILIVVLVLLWSMSSETTPCTQLCLPDTTGDIVCKCQAERLESYLDQKYLEKKKEMQTSKTNYDEPYFLRYKELRSTWNLKPVAHLSGSKLSDTQRDHNSPMAAVRQWEQGNNCYLQNGMAYRNGRLVVPVRGLYHVYSFIDMHQDYIHHGMNGTMNQSISMGVYKSNVLKQNIPEEEMLCMYKPYEMPMNERFAVYDNFIGADVQLDAGDEVYIKVSNLAYVKNPSRNVFGIHLL